MAVVYVAGKSAFTLTIGVSVYSIVAAAVRRDVPSVGIVQHSLMGVALTPGGSPEAALQLADENMYKGKNRERA